VHFNLLDEDGKYMRDGVLCPRSFSSKAKCPICEYAWPLYDQGEEGKELYRAVKAKKQHLMNLLDMDEAPKEILKFKHGPMLAGEMARWLNPRTGDFTSLTEGYNLQLSKILGKDSKDGFNKYRAEPVGDKADIRAVLKAIDPDWMTLLDDLLTHIGMPDDIDKKNLEAILDRSRKANFEAEDVNADLLPNRRRGAKKKPAAAVQEDVVPIPAGEMQEEKEEVRVEEKTQTPPNCYGKDWSHLSDKCRRCAMNNACREEFLK